MSGINRANKTFSLIESKGDSPCVFISHQKADKEPCKKIADYLLNKGVDVYFDELDKDLKHARQTQNPQKVVEAISKGIKRSTHMLCVVSPNTLSSKWVPWEIGYGYESTELGVLTLKGIPDNEIPDYMKTTKVLIRGVDSIESYLRNVLNIVTTESLKELLVEKYKTFSAYEHPLKNVLDANK